MSTWNDFEYPGRESDDEIMFDPPKYGGIHTKSSRANTLYTEFVTHTVPDVRPDTHIIAVLGISGEDPNGHVNASPQQSGFMLSDFMAFWHILQGKTSHQTWLHALDFDALVPKYKQWLHGNPYKDGRKVVLDEDVLKSFEKSKHAPTQCKDTELRTIFTKSLTEACAAADGTDKTVLVLVFAHGIKKVDITPGIEIAQVGKTSRLFSQRDFLKAIKVPTKVNVTLLTTARWTGGWICNPMPPNLTAMTACSTETVSRSWSLPASSSRASGTMYASSIIQQLTSDPEAKKPLFDSNDDATTPEQGRSYAAFAHDTMSRLFRQLDKRAYEHDMKVTAQDDAAKTVSTISELAKHYLPYNNELTDTFHDGALHGLLRRIITGGRPEPTHGECDAALCQLEYRLNQTTHATDYLKMMEIPLPDGKEGYEFDTSKLAKKHDVRKYHTTFGKTVDLGELFPDPVPGQGFEYEKGFVYFVHALKASKIDDSIIKEKLTALAKIIRDKVATLTADLEKEEGNTLKWRDFFHSYGKAKLLSPRKKHRREGGSDTLRDMFTSSDEK